MTNFVLKPISFNDFAISNPCFPEDSFDKNLTGSIYYRVDPAVTNAFKFLLLNKFFERK